jgi:cell division protein FtsQ
MDAPVSAPLAPPAPRIERPALRVVSSLSPTTRDRALVPGGRTMLVPVRRRGGMLVTLGNWWVLHKRLAVRVIALLVAVTLAIGGYLMREDLGEGLGFAAALMNGQMADVGFSIASIEINGLSLTREADVAHALGIEEGSTSLGFDIAAARLRVEEIPSIAEATIRKVYPDSLVVSITEKEPVARWRIDGATMLVDASGSPIAPAGIENGELPLVIGEGAGDDALAMINLVNRYPDLTFDLAALNRVADRRWDLIFYSGLRVQLPETGVVDALSRLNDYQLEHQLLQRDLDLIDMRVAQYVAVRPTVREEDDQ